MSDVAIVILAAGTSSRLGRPKQTLRLAGKPLAAHVASVAKASDADRIVAVLGGAADETQAALEHLVDEFVTNPAYDQGQGTSISAGVRYIDATSALLGTTDAVVFLLADQPGIDPAAINSVIAQWQAGKGIVMTQYRDRPGHPVLFDRAYWRELSELTADAGGRVVIAKHPDDVGFAVIDSLSPMDVDTDADWRMLQEMWPG